MILGNALTLARLARLLCIRMMSPGWILAMTLSMMGSGSLIAQSSESSDQSIVLYPFALTVSIRITSYNVCYTKLLRDKSPTEW